MAQRKGGEYNRQGTHRKKERIHQHAWERYESMNAFINRAIDEARARDKAVDKEKEHSGQSPSE